MKDQGVAPNSPSEELACRVRCLEGPACQVRPRRDALVASVVWRDLPVKSVAQRWTIYSASAGVTGTPLQMGTTSVPLVCLR